MMGLRTTQVACLARLDLIYFRRRALSLGPLATAPGRILIGLAFAVAGIAMTIGSYLFLKSVFDEDGAASLAFEVSSVSVVFWVLIIFAFIKLLFMKSEEFLQHTTILPATNRERAAALALFEGSMVLAVSLALFVPMVASILALSGPGMVAHAFLAIVFPALLTYLAASVAFNVILVWAVTLQIGGRHNCWRSSRWYWRSLATTRGCLTRSRPSAPATSPARVLLST